MTVASVAVGFTGTRRGLTPAQLEVVRARLWRPEVGVVHSGDCVGGDEQFWALAVERGGLWTEGHPPEDPRWRAWCAYDTEWAELPYLARNRVIVDRSTEVLACPGERHEQRRGSGTWATVRYAARRRPLTIVYPDGSVSGPTA